MDFRELNAQLALPYLPASPDAVAAFVDLARPLIPTIPAHRAVDLGAGDGRVLVALARAFPRLECVGYEINAELHQTAVSRARAQGLANVTVHRADFFRISLAPFGLVWAFSLPTLARAFRHLFRTIIPGAVVACYRYDLLEGAPGFELVTRRESPPLFVYRANE